MDIPLVEMEIAGGTLALTGGLIWGVPKHARKNGPSSLDVIAAACAKFQKHMAEKYVSLVGNATSCVSMVHSTINGTVYELAAELKLHGTASILDITDELDAFLIALKRQLLTNLRDSLEPRCSTDQLEQVYALDPIVPKAESTMLVSV